MRLRWYEVLALGGLLVMLVGLGVLGLRVAAGAMAAEALECYGE